MSSQDLIWHGTDNILKSFFWVVAGTWIIYQFVKVVYNLFFHPLSHIPGPKLAAASYFLEFYYDVIKSGSYTKRIWQMHEQYGRAHFPFH